MNVPAEQLATLFDLYERLGAKLFPVYEISEDGRCSCGNEDCNSPGKHPKSKNGFKDATDDREQWELWDGSNLGLRTGGGIMVLDVDAGHGGIESLESLQNEWAILPETVVCNTGGGGKHLYFSVTEELKNSVGTLGHGLDVRCDGGYVVCPPSNHRSGGVYSWDNDSHPMLVDVAPCPDWLLKLVRTRDVEYGEAVREEGTVKYMLGERNTALFKEGCSLRGKGSPRAVIQTLLLAMNKEQNYPRLDPAEVRAIIDQVMKQDMNNLPKLGTFVPDGGADTQWMVSLKTKKDGTVTKEAGNASVVLQHHGAWHGVLGYDEFKGELLWVKDGPEVSGFEVPKAGERVADHHMAYVGHWLSKSMDLAVPKQIVGDAMEAAARSNTVHPLREWLMGLEWDGVDRVNEWLLKYCGVLDTPYARAVGQWWLVSAVARVLRPGCQADHILVLEGKQGLGKSTVLELLCGKDYFLGNIPDVGNKDAVVALQGHWIVEIAELDAFRGAASTKIKDFLSQRVDDYRPPYGRFNVARPRCCVFAGTTNETSYLHDTTGGRRFWPVKCTRIDREGLAADRAQLWAEVVQMWAGGAVWWPSDDMQAMLQDEQEQRLELDVWEDQLRGFVLGKDEVPMRELLMLGLGIDMDKVKRSDQIRVGKCMMRLGYLKRRVGRRGVREYVYAKRA